MSGVFVVSKRSGQSSWAASVGESAAGVTSAVSKWVAETIEAAPPECTAAALGALETCVAGPIWGIPGLGPLRSSGGWLVIGFIIGAIFGALTATCLASIIGLVGTSGATSWAKRWAPPAGRILLKILEGAIAAIKGPSKHEAPAASEIASIRKELQELRKQQPEHPAEQQQAAKTDPPLEAFEAMCLAPHPAICQGGSPNIRWAE